MQTYMADCLDVLSALDDDSVDAVIADPPYGSVACSWDTVIPFQPLWNQLRRVVKGNGAVVLNAQQPFSSALVMSNPSQFRYRWGWDKVFAGNFVQAKRTPLYVLEDVLVFSFGKGVPLYNPQMTARETPIKKGANPSATSAAIPMRGAQAGKKYEKTYTQKYPTNILQFSGRVEGRGIHPTQKPVALVQYLLRTHTNPGDVVLDFCAGSFTTGVACLREGREFIGIEKDEEYYFKGLSRMAEEAARLDKKQEAAHE